MVLILVVGVMVVVFYILVLLKVFGGAGRGSSWGSRSSMAVGNLCAVQ